MVNLDFVYSLDVYLKTKYDLKPNSALTYHKHLNKALKNPLALKCNLENPYEISGVAAFSRILAEENLYRTEDVKLNRQKTYWVDESFPAMFAIPVVEGSTVDTLSKPFSGMVSEEVAKKFFEDKSPLGKILILNEGLNMEVRGIFKKPAGKSNFDFDYLMSYATVEFYNQFQNNWDTDACYTYIQLESKMNPAEFSAGLERFAAATYVNYPKKNQQVELKLQPVASIHLHSHLQNELTANSQFNFLIIISILGLFTLLVSWLNFAGMVSSRYLSNHTSFLMNPERITKGNLFVNELKRNGISEAGTISSDMPGKPVYTELGRFLWLTPAQSHD